MFKFQVREEHRINKVFHNIEDFLQHWLNENGCKENDKLKQLYVNKRPQYKKTRASKGLESFQKKSLLDTNNYHLLRRQNSGQRILHKELIKYG